METLFPRQLTSEYRGNPIARWVFMLLTIVTIGRSLVHILAPDGGAQSIATIPLNSMTSGGREAVVFMFAMWGLSQLLMGLVYVIVLVRYSALIPLMYLLLIIEYASRILVGMAKPIETIGTAPGGMGNYVLMPLALVMLFLCLKKTSAR